MSLIDIFEKHSTAKFPVDFSPNPIVYCIIHRKLTMGQVTGKFVWSRSVPRVTVTLNATRSLDTF